MIALVLTGLLGVGALGYVAYIHVEQYRAQQRERVLRALGGETVTRETPEDVLHALKTRLLVLENSAAMLEARALKTIAEIESMQEKLRRLHERQRP